MWYGRVETVQIEFAFYESRVKVEDRETSLQVPYAMKFNESFARLWKVYMHGKKQAHYFCWHNYDLFWKENLLIINVDEWLCFFFVFLQKKMSFNGYKVEAVKSD